MVLAVNNSYCWAERARPGEDSREPRTSGEVCVDMGCDPDNCYPPQGNLQVHHGGRVRIDVGTEAKRVKLGRREARRTSDNGRYWRWHVPDTGSKRVVELAVWYPRQSENPYTQGPVR